MKLSRRSFVLGGGAALAAAGLSLTGCNHYIGTKEARNEDAIKAMMVDSFSDFSYLGTANPTIASIGWHIFEALYDIDPVTNKVYPALAADWSTDYGPYVSDIKIREDAKFSNGSLVLAGDVVYSFEVAKKKDSINFMLDFIEKVEVVDKNTVRIKTKTPLYGKFDERLSLVKIVQSTASITEENNLPIGTGPYMITEMDGNPGGVVKLSPNGLYNGPLGKATNKIELRINPEEDARAAEVISGAASVCEDLPLDKVEDARNISFPNFIEALSEIGVFLCLN